MDALSQLRVLVHRGHGVCVTDTGRKLSQEMHMSRSPTEVKHLLLAWRFPTDFI